MKFPRPALPFKGFLQPQDEEPTAAATETNHRLPLVAATSSSSKTITTVVPQYNEVGRRRSFFIRALASSPLLAAIAVAAASTALSFDWVLDSGASFCMTGNLELLQGLHCADLVTATVANGQLISSTMCGRAVGAVNLSGVRYIPGAPANLISTGFLVRRGCEITHNIHGVEIWKGDVLVGRGRLLPNNQWSLDSFDDIHLGEPPACPVCPDPHWMLIG